MVFLASIIMLPSILIGGEALGRTSPHVSAAPMDRVAGLLAAEFGTSIATENALPGSPRSEWDVEGRGDGSIVGFATDFSVDITETVNFKVDTDAPDYRIDIYRLGWYGGDGARLVDTVLPSVPLPQAQPDCLFESGTNLTDCGNWSGSASWTVPGDAVSGVYVGRLVRADTEGASHITFIVRDDDGNSDMVLQTSDTTWQAYNTYGGFSLYSGAVKVSYNRPFGAPIVWGGDDDIDDLFSADYPLIRWIERNGYDVSYISGMDTHRYGSELLDHNTFISVGHDEYWSGQQRQNSRRHVTQGSTLPSSVATRSSGKRGWEPASTVRRRQTGRWSRTRKRIPGRRLILPVQACGLARGAILDSARQATAVAPKTGSQGSSSPSMRIATTHWWFRSASERCGSGVTHPSPRWVRESATFPNILGHEWDEDVDNGFRPAGLARFSETTVDVGTHIQDYGSTYGPGRATHRMTMYRAPVVRWSSGRERSTSHLVWTRRSSTGPTGRRHRPILGSSRWW